MGGWDAPSHWIVIAILVIVLFGYKKMPDAARSLGRSLRIFKTEIKGMGEDDKARKAREDAADAEPAEPRALPAADIVKRETEANAGEPSRPRPSPSPPSRG